MIIKKVLSTTILAIILIASNAQIEFFEGSIEEAVAKATKENKMLFVDCYTEWCYWCKVLDKKTFPDAEVGKYFNENYVSIKLDMEREGFDVGLKYRISGYPAGLVFKSDGSLVSKGGGYMPPADFIAFGKESKEITTGPAIAKLSDKLEFPAFYVNSFTNKTPNKDGSESKRVWPKEEELNKYLDENPDLLNEVSWSIFQRFVRKGKHVEAFFKVKEGEKFSVVTKDGSVDVLGTSFNVKSRFRLFMVSCYTGKVRVWTEYEETVLTPGMECKLLENKFINTTNNLETPLWLSGESRFDNTPILTVIEELEMIYDISIVDKRINANLKFTGWVPHNDLDAAAKIVFEPLNISFNKLQDNKYEVIERK